MTKQKVYTISAREVLVMATSKADAIKKYKSSFFNENGKHNKLLVVKELDRIIK